MRRVVLAATVVALLAVGAVQALRFGLVTPPPVLRRWWRETVGIVSRALTRDGPVIVLLGDSNTCGFANGCESSVFYWPSRRPVPRGWAIDDFSRPGMTASDRHACSNDVFKRCDVDGQCGGGNTCVPGTLLDGLSQAGARRLERIIEKYTPWNAEACRLAALGAAPQLVIALGTNDIVELTGFGVGQQLLTLYDRAHATLTCFDVYVAMIPPRRDADPVRVKLANVTIRVGMDRRGVGGRIIPFDQQTPDELRPDGVHMTEEGQEHRAAIAFAALGW